MNLAWLLLRQAHNVFSACFRFRVSGNLNPNSAPALTENFTPNLRRKKTKIYICASLNETPLDFAYLMYVTGKSAYCSDKKLSLNCKSSRNEFK